MTRQQATAGTAHPGAQVPEDAQVMDLVFSDTGDLHGGFYDNNGGLDYHIVCTGGSGQAPRLRVVHITVEMAPIAKVPAAPPPHRRRCRLLTRAGCQFGPRITSDLPDILLYIVEPPLHQVPRVVQPWSVPSGEKRTEKFRTHSHISLPLLSCSAFSVRDCSS